MKQEINLTSSTTARLSEGEPFLVGVNDTLELEFSSTYYLLLDLVISLKNGNKQGKCRVKDRKFTVPEEFLFAGKLEIGIDLIMRGDVAKRWNVVPVILKETESGVRAVDEITVLQSESAQLKKQLADIAAKYNVLAENFNALAKAHNELAETVSAIKENY